MLKSYFALMIRNLCKQIGYTLINISGLAIGMTCCVLIFLFVQDELRFDAHGEESSRVFRVANGKMASGPPSLGPVLKSEFPEVLEYARLKPPFGVWLMRFGDHVFYEKRVYWADASVFEVFSWPLVKGDPATALSKPNTVVISQEMAAKYFPGQDPMGRILSADDDFLHLEVTGVMYDIPVNSHFIADILFSTATMPSLYGTGVLDDWTRTDFYTYIVLSTETSADALEAKFPALVYGYQREGAESLVLDPSLQAIGDIHLHSDLENELGTNSDVSYVYILSSIGFFMLLIACINFMNLATARSAMRAREVGLRKVLGAQRGELIKQFIGETVLMSVLSLVMSLILVSLITPAFNIFAAKNLSLGLDNGALYLSLLGIVLFVGVVAGIYPALVLSSFQPGAVLKDSMKIGGAGAMLRKSLVVFQFVIATAFIVGTSVVYDQLSYIQAKRLGFDKEHVITVPAAISPILQRLDLFAKGLEADSRIIGVTSSSSLPGRSGGTGILQRVPVRPEGHVAEKPIQISGLWAEPDFNETLGLELVAGRTYWQENAIADSSSVVLNEAAVVHLGWESSQNAIGGTAQFLDRQLTVIGVVRDFHMRSLHSPIEPLVVFLGGGNHISIRVATDEIGEALGYIESTWQDVYPDYPFIYSFLNEDFEQLYRNESRLSLLFSVFSSMTVFIACLGLLGLASFTAEKRTREIGVRKVLGASAMNVVLMLSREVVVLILFSNIIAWGLAYVAMDSWLQEFAYRVDLGLGSFLLGGSLTLVIAILTVGFQALKASFTNPIDALRTE